MQHRSNNPTRALNSSGYNCPSGVHYFQRIIYFWTFIDITSHKKMTNKFNPMLKSVYDNKNFKSWPLIGWRLGGRVRKSLLTNRDFSMIFFSIPHPVISLQFTRPPNLHPHTDLEHIACHRYQYNYPCHNIFRPAPTLSSNNSKSLYPSVTRVTAFNNSRSPAMSAI